MRSEVIEAETDRSVVLHNAPWSLYEAFLDAYGEQPCRMSYDDGLLEIPMTLSVEHEGLKFFLGALVDRIAEVFMIPTACRGSSTLKADEKRKGLEADQCFWISHSNVIRHLKRIDLGIHPPPDLVIEVDVTHAAIDRESIYAALGVPEMWHYDRSTGLTGWINREGTWERTEFSRSFPMIRLIDVNAFVDRFVAGEEETALRSNFRKWLEDLKASEGRSA